jgi:hypothetical protein
MYQTIASTTSPSTIYNLSEINVYRTKYQSVSAKYLSLSLNGIHFAGIIVVDENGKNMFYNKDYKSIVTMPEILILSQQEISKPLNKLFKQTVNLDYNREKGLEYNVNLINSQIDFINSNNIFSYESDGIIREVIVDLNPGKNGNVLVSQVILLVSKDKCSNGNLCMYDNVNGDVSLFNSLDNVMDNSQFINKELLEKNKTLNINWKYSLKNSITDISLLYQNYILNFDVKDISILQQFKDIKKSKFVDVNSNITLDYVNFEKITNLEVPTSSSVTTKPILTTGANISNSAVQLLPGQVINLLNDGLNVDVLSANGIMYNPSRRGPTTNIIQSDYKGTSNIYSPYIYYNKGVSEKFTARDNTNDTDKKYYFYNGI